MPKRLAITIAGAVSLGSYEAGVLYEVLEAIQKHNADPATTAENQIAIDVLTGASAGGMTAVILAQKLMYSADQFVGPYDNPLYNTWVKRITLEALEQPGADEPALHSLFSSDLIEEISKETILSRYTGTPQPAQRHSSVGDSLRVGVALTNLNGIAYGYPVTPGGQFDYIDYGDQFTRHVVSGTSDTQEFWEPLRQAAVACGAFPIAFRPQDVSRSARAEPDDYPGPNLLPWPQDPQTYTYSDGGILQNQPLGMAKNLVDLIDCHLDQDSRFYLFVSPHAKDPAASDTLHAANADYFRLIVRLISVAIGQSGFEDWITARDVNQKIDLLDRRAQGLAQAISAANSTIDVDALQKTSTSILALFFPGGSHRSPGAREDETLDHAQQRIARQYTHEIAAVGPDPVTQYAFRDAVLAFETAAGLGARDCMTIYGIIASDSELAGAGLEAFLGFFDQTFRDHDYDVGRTKARAILTDPALNHGIGPILYVGSPIRPIDSRLDGLKLRNVPAADLTAFKAGIRTRLNQMLHELWGPVWSLAAIPGSDLILDSILDRMIANL